jgi:hypothetical protein
LPQAQRWLSTQINPLFIYLQTHPIPIISNVGLRNLLRRHTIHSLNVGFQTLMTASRLVVLRHCLVLHMQFYYNMFNFYSRGINCTSLF